MLSPANVVGTLTPAELRNNFLKGLPGKRRKACRWVNLPDGQSALLTRGERKQLARRATVAIIQAQQAQPDLLPAKFLSSHGRLARAAREAIAALPSAPAKPKRVRKPKAAA